MKKLNLISAAVLALAAGGAFAGNLTTANTKFAVEIFGTGTDATTSVKPGAATYSLSTITAVNPSSKVYFTVRLTGGAKFNAAPAITTIGYAGAAVAVAADATNNGATVALSTDKTTMLVTITNNSGSTSTLGLGAFSYTPATGDIVNVNTALGTVGGTIGVSVGMTTTAPTAYEAADAQSTVDLPLPSANLANAVQGIAAAVSAPSTYDSKIDVAATTPSTVYAGTTGGGSSTIATLGRIVVTAGSGKQADGTTGLTIATGAAAFVYADTGSSVKVVATPNAGGAFAALKASSTSAAPIGRLFVVAGTDCTGTALQTVSLTATTATQAQTLTLTAANFQAGVTLDADTSKYKATFTLCQGTNDGNAISPVHPTIDVTTTGATALANYAKTSATGLGYNLTYNGAQVDTTTYWPAALGTYGYMGYTRIINTGKVPAVVSGAFINPTTGAVGTAAALTATLPAGAHVMLSSAQVEAVLGTAPSNLTAGRLRLTGPTDKLTVQSFVQVNGAPPQETSGAQSN